DWFDITMDKFSSYLQIVDTDDAIEHLLRVATGLNSMVLGETQILGQVRNAFFLAQDNKTTETIFNELLKRVITFAKKSNSTTSNSENAVSVSYAAVELAKQKFKQIDDKKVANFGAGDMGELAVQNLVGSGVHDITVINRSIDRANKLATKFNAQAVDSTFLDEDLLDVDILISSTASQEPILNKAKLEPIHMKRKGKHLF